MSWYGAYVGHVSPWLPIPGWACAWLGLSCTSRLQSLGWPLLWPLQVERRVAVGNAGLSAWSPHQPLGLSVVRTRRLKLREGCNLPSIIYPLCSPNVAIPWPIGPGPKRTRGPEETVCSFHRHLHPLRLGTGLHSPHPQNKLVHRMIQNMPADSGKYTRH